MPPPDFSQTTKDDVFLANAYRCANPDCRVPILGPKTGVPSGTFKVGDVAHIRDARARPPRTPRYDPAMTDDERADISNALPLCVSCHRTIDSNPNLYPVRRLRQWKELSERLVNYSRPVLSMTPPFFLMRGMGPVDVFGGHVLIGPVALDAVGSSVELELMTMTGGKLPIFRSYFNPPNTLGVAALGPDWKRFLARAGLDGLYTFTSHKNPAFLEHFQGVTLCPYRLRCTLEYDGELLEFSGPWEALRVQAEPANPNLVVFDSASLPWLPNFMRWYEAHREAGSGLGAIGMPARLDLFQGSFCVAWCTGTAQESVMNAVPGQLEQMWEETSYVVKAERGGDRMLRTMVLSFYDRVTSSQFLLVRGEDPGVLLQALPDDPQSYLWQRVTGQEVTLPQPLNQLGVLGDAV